jgi:hypothetical protein
MLMALLRCQFTSNREKVSYTLGWGNLNRFLGSTGALRIKIGSLFFMKKKSGAFVAL